jgi:hypothetical protein
MSQILNTDFKGPRFEVIRDYVLKNQALKNSSMAKLLIEDQGHL